MKHTTKTGFLASLAMGAVLALSASGAMAAWNFETSVLNSGKATASSDGITATATALSIANGATGTTGQTFASGATFASATLAVWSDSGLGVKSGTDSASPTHAVDNNENTDLVLLSFSSSVILDTVMIGWNGGYDSDISLLRWTGTSTPASVVGKTWADIKATSSKDGWELVGNYLDLGVDTPRDVNAADKGSSWWMVSAFNTGFGGTTADGNSDYFKLSTLTGTATPPSQVPEPGSLALMGAALVGLLGVRRRAAGKR